jgi:hypothetical protein
MISAGLLLILFIFSTKFWYSEGSLDSLSGSWLKTSFGFGVSSLSSVVLFSDSDTDSDSDLDTDTSRIARVAEIFVDVFDIDSSVLELVSLEDVTDVTDGTNGTDGVVGLSSISQPRSSSDPNSIHCES